MSSADRNKLVANLARRCMICNAAFPNAAWPAILERHRSPSPSTGGRTMSKLNGEVAVVTGGSSGIGLAVAARFAKEGAHVFITGHRQSEIEKARTAIGQSVTAVRGDVSNAGDLDALYAAVRSSKGRIDILVANAGAN